MTPSEYADSRPCAEHVTSGMVATWTDNERTSMAVVFVLRVLLARFLLTARSATGDAGSGATAGIMPASMQIGDPVPTSVGMRSSIAVVLAAAGAAGGLRIGLPEGCVAGCETAASSLKAFGSRRRDEPAPL